MSKEKSKSSGHGDSLSKFFEDGKVGMRLSRKVQMVQFEPVEVNVAFEGTLRDLEEVEEAYDVIYEVLIDQMDARLEDMADIIEEEMNRGSSRGH